MPPSAVTAAQAERLDKGDKLAEQLSASLLERDAVIMGLKVLVCWALCGCDPAQATVADLEKRGKDADAQAGAPRIA